MKTLALLIAIVLTAMLPSPARPLTTQNSAPARTAGYLYKRYCASCHGVDGKAATSKAKATHSRDLTDAAWQDDVSDERIFNSIMNGRKVRGDMPGFSRKISEPEGDSLVTYIRNLRK